MLIQIPLGICIKVLKYNIFLYCQLLNGITILMNIAIMIGRAGSKGFPGKNIKTVNGKKLCEYPLIAAKKSKFISKIFVSTDCPAIKRISKKYKCEIINRPKRLANNKSLGDHVFEHAYFEIKKKVKNKFCNIIIC